MLSCNLKRFLSVSNSFNHKVVQIWFVLHETWYITQVGIYYCIEMVRIENNSHMIEITCKVGAFMVFKTLFVFSRIK